MGETSEEEKYKTNEDEGDKKSNGGVIKHENSDVDSDIEELLTETIREDTSIIDIKDSLETLDDQINSKKLNGYRKVHQSYVQKYGEENEKSLEVKQVIAGLLVQEGKLDDALEEYNDIYGSYENLLGKDDEKTNKIKENISLVLLKQGNVEESLKEFKNYYQSCEDLCKGLEENDEVLELKLKFANHLADQKQFDEAETVFDEVVNEYTERYGDTNEKNCRVKVSYRKAIITKGTISRKFGDFC